MARIVAILIVVACVGPPGSARAQDPVGKWGVGAGTGITGSGRLTPGVTALRVYARRHAWGVDVSIDSDGLDALDEGDVLFVGPRIPDALVHAPRDVRRRFVLLGLRWRSFSRDLAGLTTFLDLCLAATYNSLDVRTPGFHRERRLLGAEPALGPGVEWFPRGSAVTIAVQSTVLAYRLERNNMRYDDPSYRGSSVEQDPKVTLELAPRLYVRAYL